MSFLVPQHKSMKSFDIINVGLAILGDVSGCTEIVESGIEVDSVLSASLSYEYVPK